MFSISTVASSTRMPTASARPPSVIDVERLAEAREHDDRHQDRQRDRDARSRASSATSRGRAGSSGRSAPRRSAASRSTPCNAARTNTDWSNSGLTCELRRQRRPGCAAARRCTRWTMSSVEAVGVFRTVSSAERRPSTCTMVVCDGEAVVHLGDVAQVHRRVAVLPHRDVVQRARGCRATSWCGCCTRSAPSSPCRPGRMTFCALTAFDTSSGRQPLGVERVRVEVDHDLRAPCRRRAAAPARPARWRAACG